MKRMRKTFGVLLAAALAFANILAAPVQAAGDYTYTVRIFSGRQGTINGGEVMELAGLRYGERVTFNQNMVSIKDSGKYYIKGIRESGKDNDTAVGGEEDGKGASFEVTGDQDYVVAYGILSEAVAYTVRYLDPDGNELAPSETYYGNVGDKPVIAFLYVEGYLPQAYNLTRTLSDNASENTFDFIYTPVDETAAGGAAGGAAGAGDAAAGEGADQPAEGAGQPAEGENAEGGETTDIGDEMVPEAPGPEEIKDLDDETVPLGGSAPGKGGVSSNIVKVLADASPFWLLAIAAGTVAAVSAISGGLWFFIKRKRKESDGR